MGQQPITIGGVHVVAGEGRYIDLPLPHLYTHTHMTMPVYVLHGKQPGPRLFVSAAIHGDEINGVEIIRRLIKSAHLRKLSGTLIAVPIVNSFGFISKSRYLPDRRDLNRSFPGSERGSMSARMAHLFLEKIASRCTHGIDLHTAATGRTNLPQVRIDLKNSGELQAMAKAFNAPIILSSGLREGSLRKAASELGVETILYEAGEALRFEETAIRIGVQGILAVMRELKMLPPTRQAATSKSLISYGSTWARSPQSGILRDHTLLGKLVQKGDVLGHVADPFGASETIVTAPTTGLVIGKSTLPLVHEGEAIYHLAHIDEGWDVEQIQQPSQHEIEPDM